MPFRPFPEHEVLTFLGATAQPVSLKQYAIRKLFLAVITFHDHSTRNGLFLHFDNFLDAVFRREYVCKYI